MAKSAQTVWLCRPGLANDPCRVPQDVSIVSSNGAAHVVHHANAGATPFDCFFIYPTVSTERGANADLAVQGAQRDVAFVQASAFSQVCRVWAPIYRQRTLRSLSTPRQRFASLVAFRSVLSAWRDYLAHDNHGRPVILIGHSQGAGMVIRLLQSQFDASARRRHQLVVAIALGGNVTVANGSTRGGSFKNISLCGVGVQFGCVIAYSSFPAQPPSTSFFGIPGQGVSDQSGQTTTRGVSVACVNPAAIGSWSTSTLRAQFPVGSIANSPRIHVATTWVQYTDLYRAQCRRVGNTTWLQVTATPARRDVRPLISEPLGAQWGYHVDDVQLGLGNLVDDVRLQERAYLAAQGAAR